MTSRRTRSHGARVVGTAIFAMSVLVLSACGSAEEPDGPAPTAEPDTSEQPEGEPEESTAPEKKGEFTVVFSAAVPQVEKLTTVLAIEQLEREGYEITQLWLQSPEDVVQAVARGDADFGSASVNVVFGATAQGIPVRALMAQNGPAYSMVAPADVASPEGLDGMRVGIHSLTSQTTVYTNLLMDQYPDVETEVLIVPGSANRITAMAGGDLDASVIQIADLPALERLASGEFHELYNYAAEHPGLIDSVIFTSQRLLDADPDRAKDMIRAMLSQVRAVQADPSIMADAIERLIPDATAEDAATQAQAYVDSNVWPADGSFTPQTIEMAIDLISRYGGLESTPNSTDCCDASLLDEVLAE